MTPPNARQWWALHRLRETPGMMAHEIEQEGPPSEPHLVEGRRTIYDTPIRAYNGDIRASLMALRKKGLARRELKLPDDPRAGYLWFATDAGRRLADPLEDIFALESADREGSWR